MHYYLSIVSFAWQQASDDEEEGEEAKMNALLARDIECVRKLYGSHALDYR